MASFKILWEQLYYCVGGGANMFAAVNVKIYKALIYRQEHLCA